jgi:hypothetical protein
MQLPTRVVNPFSTLKLERTVFSRDKILEVLLYVACFFPFTMWIPYYFVPALYTASDTQPYALVFSFFIAIIYLWKEPQISKLMVTILLFCIGVSVFAIVGMDQTGTMSVLKIYSTYVSIISISLAVYLVLKKNGGLNEKIVKICIWIWFAAGFIQMYVKEDFGHYLVVRQATNATRGVVGLATEPSAYGYVCFFLLLVALTFKRNMLLYVGLLLIQILAFAGSSVTLLYIGVYIVGIVLNEIILRKKFAFIKAVVLIGGGIGILYYAYIKNILPTRMGILVKYVFTGRWDLLLNDGSIKLRINGIRDSITSFLENNGLPQGFGISRTFSGIGILLMECGIFALVFLLAIGIIIWKAYPRRTRFVFVFGFMVMMLSTVTFSSPVVCFYIGYCAYQGWLSNEERNKIESTMDL